MIKKLKFIGISKQFKSLGIIVLILAASVFLFFHQNDGAAITDFDSSYKKFDEAITYFTASAYVDFQENQNYIDFGNVFLQISNSFSAQYKSSERLVLATKALSLNKNVIAYLNQADHFRIEAKDALTELNRKASAIKDSELKSKAIEIADLSKKEFDNIDSYNNATLEKRDYVNEYIEKIISDNGGLAQLLNFVKQEKERSTKNNDDLTRLSKEYGTIYDNRTTAYARFQGLAGIKN